MPIKWFKMPEGELVDTATVIDRGLLIDHYPTPYLMECANQRTWNGQASTTQLIRGTRLAYLELLVDYAIDPDDQAFRIVGSRGHAKLETQANLRGDFAETRFDHGEITGIADHLEPDPAAPGFYILDDYKVSGAFKVLKGLGLTKVERKRPMLDEQGNPVLYKKAGKGFQKGDPRMETYHEVDQTKRDVRDWDLQLNHYRIRAEAELVVNGEPVRISRMRIFVPVRDGGTHTARSMGIDKKTYSLWIPIMDNAEVMEYFERKRKLLLKAMEGYHMSIDAGHDHEKALKDNAPPPCSKEEAWDGRRCSRYCDLAETCAKIGNPYLSRDEHDREEE